VRRKKEGKVPSHGLRQHLWLFMPCANSNGRSPLARARFFRRLNFWDF
jgi:hypothetical protein